MGTTSHEVHAVTPQSENRDPTECPSRDTPNIHSDLRSYIGGGIKPQVVPANQYVHYCRDIVEDLATGHLLFADFIKPKRYPSSKTRYTNHLKSTISKAVL